MLLTYASGGAGIACGLHGVHQNPPTLSVGAVLAVGCGGLLSFLRHSVFHRSDAVRMGAGWDLGARNNFQIEVGLANLAWSMLAMTSVGCGWGLAAQASAFLVFGLYLVATTIMLASWHATTADSTRPRWVLPLISMGSFGGALTAVGVLGMERATKGSC